MTKFYTITFEVRQNDFFEDDGGLEKATDYFITTLYKSSIVFNPHFDMYEPTEDKK